MSRAGSQVNEFIGELMQRLVHRLPAPWRNKGTSSRTAGKIGRLTSIPVGSGFPHNFLSCTPWHSDCFIQDVGIWGKSAPNHDSLNNVET